MKIIVCAKQVVDVSEMKIDSNTKKPILQGVPQKISDIDKNALEEAIKIKDKHSGKITVVTVGHNLELLRAYCSRIVCINKIIAFDGEPKDPDLDKAINTIFH